MPEEIERTEKLVETWFELGVQMNVIETWYYLLDTGLKDAEGTFKPEYESVDLLFKGTRWEKIEYYEEMSKSRRSRCESKEEILGVVMIGKGHVVVNSLRNFLGLLPESRA